LLKADLHVHTEYSMDCSTPLATIIERCQELGINCLAIADHGTVEGALEIQRLAPFTIIVAEEILTPHGEIMGMFLKETIPGGLSAEQTIVRIRAQGGIVCIPHAFDPLRPSALDERIVEEIAEEIDVIETFNARSLLRRSSEKAVAFARKHGIIQSAGSDAHTPGEIGNAYVEMAEFESPEEFLQALSKGKIVGHRTSPLTHFASAWNRIKNHTWR
jgi:predicted metal-dependent phosphoesterase TrpH